ncbi:hypothetical protein GOBAR_DD28619 [Gossypium barbadense]|nr:hypothetical protein GOBAR_DD28619 [Gossypium barbadense]
MARSEELQISTAKRAYRNAKEEGNRQEEARWANVIGDILKNRGEYVEALKWFRIDYDVSNKYLPEKQLLPTCQSLGEVYLRLEQYKDALIYQKKHLDLAKDANDLVEQQRASTQLGRTYHEMFLKSEDDHYSVQNAKKYFKSAMKLAQTLKENPPNNKSSFLKEYIDAHNNIGMLEVDLDNLDEALKFLAKGLAICDEEEVVEDDDGRSRLHHNLGNVYMELRRWAKAREHTEKDIMICKRIGHRQGEAKGYINLGELHYRVQRYDEAILCYQKALDLAKSMEDEDALVAQIDQNIKTVKEAINVMNDLKKEEQNLKKLKRNMVIAKGTPQERKFLLLQNSCLDCLIEKSAMIFAWLKVLIVEDMTKMIAVEAKLPSIQLSALENMHYSHMIRFDNVEEARRLQLEIDKLKQSKVEELDEKHIATDCCSETDTEGDDHCSDDMSSACLEEPDETSPKSLSKSTSNQQTVVGRKRVRLVLSDDEGDVPHEVECSARRLHKRPVDFAASDEFTRKISPASSDDKLQDTSPVASRSPSRPCNLINIEESTCSYKSVGNRTVSNGKNTRSLSNAEVVIGSDYADSASKCDINASENLLHRYNSPLKLQATDNEVDGCIEFKIDDNKINVAVSSFMAGDKISIESLKVELACLYYLQLPVEKRSKGLLPIIQNMECGGRPLESIENLDSLRNHLMNVSVDVLINGWIQKRLMKLYIDSCKELCETPNMKLLKKLYVSEVEDEVNVSECELQDISVIPLLNALHTHKGVALLDLSHNLLGNGTMEKLQRFFSSSGQKYGDLTLDLHCNRFGPTALFQICECPVLFTRLEVLNISGNRLTDACGSYLSTILEKCRALYSLNIERCSITSRTIQKVADALDTESVLSQLFIGHNNPISGNAINSLLGKLAILKRFSEFSLNGLKLSKTVVDGICHLAKTSCLSRLMLEGTAIGTDGALRLTRSLFSSTQEPLKLDLSFCGVASTYIYELNTNAIFISGILELHLGGNPIMQEGGNALSSLLLNPQCCLKVLNLKKCQLGMAGILQIVHALAENESLEELNLANNADTDKRLGILYCKPANSSESSQPNHIVSEPSLNPCSSKEFDELDPNYNKLEVADSEDDEVRVETAASGFNDSSASSCQRRNSTLECQFIQELSIAIGLAKQLQVLDLSNNGLSVQASEALYNAWSSGSRAGLSWRHIKDQIVHLSVEGNKCCRLKSCCKKD